MFGTQTFATDDASRAYLFIPNHKISFNSSYDFCSFVDSNKIGVCVFT